MKIFSFCEDQEGLRPIEVEMALWPGLPSIQFLGLPDSHLKESALRIKSAIKSSGFEFPIAQQVVVNLKPTNIKKSSRGLELAVALSYLWLTGQVSPPQGFEKVYIYGGLSLFGEVESRDSLEKLGSASADLMISGPSEAGLSSAVWRIDHLKNSDQIEIQLPVLVKKIWHRPLDFKNHLFSEKESRLLGLAALGGHHLMLAGPAGGGKSTLAQVIHSLLPEPEENNSLNPEYAWPPLIQPHHTTPLAAMLGGGSYPIHGEISRAHEGVLVLDELLEFERGVVESLREPFEQEKIRVSRLAAQKFFPVKTQIIATTNLCPCGKYTPKRTSYERCRFSLRKCRSYSEKLSGPLVDRFQVLHFCEPQKERKIAWMQILETVERGKAFQLRAGRSGWNRRRTRLELEAALAPGVREIGFANPSGSERRSLATLRVARSLADLDGSLSIELSHIDEALHYAMEPFDQLERMFL